MKPQNKTRKETSGPNSSEYVCITMNLSACGPRLILWDTDQLVCDLLSTPLCGPPSQTGHFTSTLVLLSMPWNYQHFNQRSFSWHLSWGPAWVLWDTSSNLNLSSNININSKLTNVMIILWPPPLCPPPANIAARLQ